MGQKGMRSGGIDDPPQIVLPASGADDDRVEAGS
jgi:hypothetical protein